MLGIHAKVVLSGEVPAVERHVRIPVGRGDIVRICHVWIHFNEK